jgi:hypothetical protein
MSAQLKACFNGCSFTVGEGFPVEIRDNYIYDRLVSKDCNFQASNIARGGSSNYVIFLRSAKAIMSKQYDIVLTQWSALNRIWFYPGPDAEYHINDGQIDYNYRYRDFYLNKKEKIKLENTLRILNHDYQNIFDLVDYCQILNQLANHNSITLIHINGLVPWTNDLMINDIINLKETLSSYTQSILDFDQRDDDEIIKYFRKLQKKFLELDQSNWVNIFDSFMDHEIDIGPEGHHPGINSHQWMAEQIINYIKTNKIV